LVEGEDGQSGAERADEAAAGDSREAQTQRIFFYVS
jgi:hypothetical protein